MDVADRRTYDIDAIQINGISVTQVIIDPHYEIKHSDVIDDELILALVRKLNGRFELPETVMTPYSYFATLIEFNSKQYRLVWLLEDSAIYIGVLNLYRDDRKEK